MSEPTDRGSSSTLERLFPEKRVFLKSGDTTRMVRLGPGQQILAWAGGTVLVVWMLVATSMVMIGMMKGANLRDLAVSDRALYEARLNALAEDRGRRMGEAAEARALYGRALDKVSLQQDAMLDVHMALEEARHGTESLRRLLADAIADRDALARRLDAVEHETPEAGAQALARTEAMLGYLSTALADTATERDALGATARNSDSEIARLREENRAVQEQAEAIFAQLEEAVSQSLGPLERMFTQVGLEPENILETMRGRQTGEGGPLQPIALSTSGGAPRDPMADRAVELLAHMEQVALYSDAARTLPFAMPVAKGTRLTSGFGYRRDPFGRGTRFHAGIDWAAPHGTAIRASGDGVVTQAGWQSGYGRLVTVQHGFGIESRYGHLASIGVKVGQRVSRGDRIGGMGSSGRSTGTHLHYEVRIGDQPVNPQTYLRAAENVF